MLMLTICSGDRTGRGRGCGRDGGGVGAGQQDGEHHDLHLQDRRQGAGEEDEQVEDGGGEEPRLGPGAHVHGGGLGSLKY